MTRPRRHWRDVAELDRHFDRLLPIELQRLSKVHWTPVRIAVRAAGLLCATKHTRVLDVGCGVGKLCAIGALTAAGLWVGVEQHARLVDSATELSRLLGVADRTRFLNADAFAVDWNAYDALYLYNPFELAVFADAAPLPHSIQVAQAQQKLAALPNCTRVVTFHGFGGVMPATFELLYHERTAPQGLDLALWIQRTSRASAWSLH